MKPDSTSAAAAALSTGGLGAAFAAAACCGLPAVLPAVGLGAAWLAPVVRMTSPYEAVLPWVAGIALAASLVLLWRAPGMCRPGSLCARPAVRLILLAATIAGIALLALWVIHS